METAVMAKKKPGPKPAEGGGRNVLTNIRSTRGWRDWLDRYATFRRMSVADPSLTDAEKIGLLGLGSWALENDHCWPTNAQLAERCGWRLENGKPATQKAKQVLRRLEGKGRLRREVVVTDGVPSRPKIELITPIDTPGSNLNHPGSNPTLPGVNSEPPPDRCGPAPGAEATLPGWLVGVRDRVVARLEDVARQGEAIEIEDVERVAGLVQDELANGRSGRVSKFHVALVKAVALGYDPGVVGAAIDGAADGHLDLRRRDIRHCLWHLEPRPRDLIKARSWPSRGVERRCS